MKGLLQSKTFRKNLSKWLLAYVGVMMLLTTVITYSRYISRYQGNEAKVEPAKFNIAIKELECYDTATGAVCNQDAYWSTDYISYYFLVDTTEVEVSATELLTIRLNNDFELVMVEEITNFNDVVQGDKIVNLQGIDTDILEPKRTILSDYTIGYRVSEDIGAKTGKKKAYRITVRYRRNNPTDITSSRYDDILKLDYVATQKN